MGHPRNTESGSLCGCIYELELCLDPGVTRGWGWGGGGGGGGVGVEVGVDEVG